VGGAAEEVGGCPASIFSVKSPPGLGASLIVAVWCSSNFLLPLSLLPQWAANPPARRDKPPRRAFLWPNRMVAAVSDRHQTDPISRNATPRRPLRTGNRASAPRLALGQSGRTTPVASQRHTEQTPRCDSPSHIQSVSRAGTRMALRGDCEGTPKVSNRSVPHPAAFLRPSQLRMHRSGRRPPGPVAACRQCWASAKRANAPAAAVASWAVGRAWAIDRTEGDVEPGDRWLVSKGRGSQATRPPRQTRCSVWC
jgi:hypothetical protein